MTDSRDRNLKMMPGDFVSVIEYPGSKFSGVVSEVFPEKVVVTASNGSSDWRSVHVQLADRPVHQLPQILLLDQD